MKKAYVVAEIRIADAAGYAQYVPLSTASLQQHGGHFLVRGGQRVQREGADAQHNAEWRTVITEFPSLAAAQAWYDSAEYTEARALRHAYSSGRLYIVEGS